MQNDHDQELNSRIDDEVLLMQYESAWTNDSPPLLDDFLPESTSSRYLAITSELIKIEMEHRLRRRLPLPSRVGFLQNDFAGFGSKDLQTETEKAVQQLLEFEVSIRSSLGEALDSNDLLLRYPTCDSQIRESIEQINRRRQSPSPSVGSALDSDCPRLQIVELTAGQQIAKFEIIEKIGSGAFSTVYSARDLKLRRTVALKVFDRNMMSNVRLKQRVLREAQTASMICHEHVVAIFETGTFNQIDYIASQLVEGSTLEHEMSIQRLDPMNCVEIMSKVASALEAAHSMGITHRDLKPANIMLQHGHPYVIDFGLAHLSTASLELTHEGDVIGTPSYMSPEQAVGKGWDGDPRNDIYSFGAVLFHMVTNQLPFQGTTTQVIHKLIHQAPVSPSKLNKNVTRDLENVILKCMEKDPADRYQTAKALRRDLENYRQGLPIEARPLSRHSRIIRWIVKTPAVSIPMFLLFLLTTFWLGTLTQLFEVRNQRDRAQTAEIENRRLFADAAAEAGFLALNQGKFESAISHFEKFLANPNTEPECQIQVRISLVLSYLGKRELQQALFHFLQIDTSCTLPQYHLLKGELVLEKLIADTSAITIVETALSNPKLTAADRSYAFGLTSNNSIEALKHFQTAVELQNHHHRAYRMLTIMQFSLARFDELAEQLQIAKQLFPQDTDFVLLDALRLAAQGDLAEADAMIYNSGLSNEDCLQWCRFNEFVYGIVNDMPYDSGLAEFDAKKLVQLAVKFDTDVSPLLKKRGWHFPPRIANSFSELPGKILRSDLDKSPEVIDQLTQLVEVHPEASLQNLLAGFHIQFSYDPNCTPTDAIQHLVSANQLFQKATQASTFLGEGNKFAWKGVFATSVALAINHQYDVMTYQDLGSDASIHLELNEVSDRHLAVLSMILMNFQRPQLAERWILEWVKQEGPTGQRRPEALWILAKCYRDQRQWIECLDTTRLLLETNPQHTEAIKLVQETQEQLQAIIAEHPKPEH